MTYNGTLIEISRRSELSRMLLLLLLLVRMLLSRLLLMLRPSHLQMMRQPIEPNKPVIKDRLRTFKSRLSRLIVPKNDQSRIGIALKRALNINNRSELREMLTQILDAVHLDWNPPYNETRIKLVTTRQRRISRRKIRCIIEVLGRRNKRGGRRLTSYYIRRRWDQISGRRSR